MDAVRAFFINTPQIDTQGRVIEVAGWPSKVGTEVIDGAVLDNVMSFPVDGSKESKKLQENNGRLGPVVPDLVILATGYDTSFAFLDKKYPTLSETTQRGIWKDDELDFAYIGFVRPSVGEDTWPLRLIGTD